MRLLSISSFLCCVLLSFAALAEEAPPAASIPQAEQGFTTSAQYAYLVDYDTGAVLYDLNGNERMIPSSMTKLMTAHIVFDHLKAGSLTMQETVPISEAAWSKQGSKMFVPIGERVPVSDLLQGVIIQSGNDACIALAERISGSEERFAVEMNRLAKELGMNDTHFLNATGWPDEGHYTTAHDLALIAAHTIRTYPDYYHYYSQPEFTFHGIRQYNRNLLLNSKIGVDGLKTGHTEAAGYGMVSSAKEGDRRVIAVVNGLKNEKERAVESERLLLYGLREFTNAKLFKAGETVETADVWMGSEKTVPLVLDEDLVFTRPRSAYIPFSVKVSYQGPIKAPIKKGDVIAKLHISQSGRQDKIVDLKAGQDVKKLSFFGRIGASLANIF